MRTVSVSARPKLASCVGPHSSVVADVESSPEVVVTVPIDNVVARKEVAVRAFGPQTYRCGKVWLTIFQVDEVQNPVCPFRRSLGTTCWNIHER